MLWATTWSSFVIGCYRTCSPTTQSEGANLQLFDTDSRGDPMICISPQLNWHQGALISVASSDKKLFCWSLRGTPADTIFVQNIDRTETNIKAPTQALPLCLRVNSKPWSGNAWIHPFPSCGCLAAWRRLPLFVPSILNSFQSVHFHPRQVVGIRFLCPSWPCHPHEG